MKTLIKPLIILIILNTNSYCGNCCEKEIKLTIKTIMGKHNQATSGIQVSPRITGKGLKKKLETNFPKIYKGRLLFNNKPIDDEKTLADQNIKDGDTLYFYPPKLT